MEVTAGMLLSPYHHIMTVRLAATLRGVFIWRGCGGVRGSMEWQKAVKCGR